MTRQTITIGDASGSNTDQFFWTGLGIPLTSSLLNQFGTGTISTGINVFRLYISTGRVIINLIGTEGFTDQFEVNGTITIEAGSISFEIPAPRNGITAPDFNDPYNYVHTLVSEQTEFLSHFFALSQADRDATTLTFDDHDVQRIILAGSADLGNPTASAELTVENVQRIILAGSADLGNPTASAELTVENVQRIILAGSADLGNPTASAELTVENVQRIILAGSADLGNPTASAELTVENFIPPATPSQRALLDARALTGVDQIYALEISHSALTESIKIVADVIEHVIESNTYLPLMFKAEIPQSKEGEIRQATIRIDNIGYELMQWVNLTQGGRDAVIRAMMIVSPEGTETNSAVVWEVTMNCGITEITNEYVIVTLTDEPVFDRPSVLLRHDSSVSPGLF